jgi:DNA-binding CsgD family transcriptional regulator
MANNLNDLIRRYTILHNRKISRICAPLNILGISTFAYYTIENDGRFGIVSNYPEQLDFFYSEKLYLKCPYLTHPSFFRSGYALIPLTTDPDYLQTSQQLHKVSHLFLIMKKMQNKIEGFFFTTPELHDQKCTHILNQIDLLNKFGLYFKREAKGLIEQILSDGYNLHDAKGEAFLLRDQCLPLSNTNTPMLQFLKKTTSLSRQEQECLDLFKQGNSAQAAAAILGLSRRTVEHYFENIKDKLGCNSKWELLEW